MSILAIPNRQQESVSMPYIALKMNNETGQLFLEVH